MTVGENIRRIRQERSLTQKQLGKLVGVAEHILVHMKAAEEILNLHLSQKKQQP